MQTDNFRTSAAASRTLAVLLVDDHEDFLNATAVFLEQDARFDVVGRARNGLDAYRLAQELVPDLVLMDITMPRVDGLNATRAIKARPGAPKVLLVSMHGGRAYRDAAESAGADGFLPKSEIVEGLLPLIGSLFPTS